MIIEKKFTIRASQEDTWNFITSPELVAACITGCEGAEQTGPGKYRAALRTKVGPIKITFHVNIETSEERPPEYAEYLTTGEEGGRASRLKARSTLSIMALDPGTTEVTYRSEITMMGRLGKLGSGMMQKVADSMGDEFVAALRSRIETSE